MEMETQGEMEGKKKVAMVGGGDKKQQSMLVIKIAKINWSHLCGFSFASSNCSLY